MAYFTPTTGVITNISNAAAGNTQTSGCTLLISIMSEDQGQISMVLPSNVYVLNSQQLQVGDRVTFFYDPQAPVPLIYPSQYRAVAAAATPYGTNAYLDVFDPMMTNTCLLYTDVYKRQAVCSDCGFAFSIVNLHLKPFGYPASASSSFALS